MVPGLDLPFVGFDPAISRDWLAVSCAAAAVLGHVWPIYHRFRGGKGAATYVGTLIILGPKLVVPMLLVWAIVLVASGFVGLATMTAAAAVPTWLAATRLPDAQPLFFYATAMAMFIVFWHRANIQRMRAGNENRFEKIMLLRSKRHRRPNESS